MDVTFEFRAELFELIKLPTAAAREAALKAWFNKWVTAPTVEVVVPTSAPEREHHRALAGGFHEFCRMIAESGKENVLACFDVTGSEAWLERAQPDLTMYAITMLCLRLAPSAVTVPLPADALMH